MIEFNGLWKWLNTFGNWLINLLYLQLLWVVFVLGGLVVFGFAPATAAMYAVLRKRAMGEEGLPVFKTFLNAYKSNFVKTNALGFLWILIGLFLYEDLMITRTVSHFHPFFYVFLLFALIGFVTFLFFLPVFVHYDLKMFSYFKQSLLIALMRPLEALAMIASLVVVYFVFRTLPVLLIVMGAPLIAFPIMRIAYHGFIGIERKKGNKELTIS